MEQRTNGMVHSGGAEDELKMSELSVPMKIVRFVVAFALILYYTIENTVKLLLPNKLMVKNVSGDVCVVTGAGSGIGRLMTQKFARKGCRMVAIDLNAEGVEETAQLVKAEGFEVHTYRCNVADRAQVYSVFERIKREVGPINILVNNAGIVAGNQTLLEMPDDGIERTMQVNATSHAWTIKAVLPEMMKTNSGHIVSIASLAGVVGVNQLAAYCASKHAAIGLMDALQAELLMQGYNGIQLTTVCPFFINTGMFHGCHTGLVPYLEPEYVAEQVVVATLRNREIIYLPAIMYLLCSISAVLPSKTIPVVNKITGFQDSMKCFDATSRDMAKKTS